ncbi:FMN-binding protein [Myxococcota bacterium]|nr:FMN-binding protein [Myxococcota bacterium]
MSEPRLPPFVVVGIVVAVCGTLLLGAHLVLAARIERNVKLEQARILVDLVGVHGLSDAETEEFVADNLREEKDASGRVVRWVYLRESTVGAVLYPMEGKGLWGPIHGVLSVSPDLETILGIRVSRHEETPGLGAEIEAGWFLKRFEGVRFTRHAEGCGPVVLHVVKAGTARDEWEIDGISGATETTRGFDRMLTETLERVQRDKEVAP